MNNYVSDADRQKKHDAAIAEHERSVRLDKAVSIDVAIRCNVAFITHRDRLAKASGNRWAGKTIDQLIESDEITRYE